MQIVADYAQEIGDIFLVKAPRAVAGARLTIVDLSPEIELQVGNEDAFNGVVAKLAGNIIFGSITEVSGVLTPCATCFFHVLTLAGGVEADRGFDNTAFLLEAGYVPWYRNKLRNQGLLGGSSLALFVQGGYKADTGAVEEATGGAQDQSAEEPESALLRLRGEFVTAPVALLSLGEHEIQLVGEAIGWRDLLNGAWYHRLKGALRIQLIADQFFDFTYESGSGAPNFNQGDQFSANVVIAF